MDRLKYIINILIVAILFGAIAMGRDGRLLGTPAEELFKNEDVKGEDSEVVDVDEMLFDGTRVINSSSLAKDVIGYAGVTPIELYVKDDVIQKVEYLDNNETPSFFEDVVNKGLLDSWNGKTLDEALALKVDAVSGATYSSVAIISNVKRAASYGLSVEPEMNPLFAAVNAKTIAGVIVILMGVLLTFLKPKNKIFEFIQLALNVVVLGFVCGSFLSLTQFVSWMSNGFNLSMSILTMLLLAVVIILPLFRKKGSYCHIHCPMGSAQELLSKVPMTKLKLKPKLNKFLNDLRYYILMLMMFLMWIGVGFEFMDYEVFSAFLISSASMVVLVMAALFLVLSLFIRKPYCRFVCPTGALLTMMQKTKP
ncbi:MAG: 4Fe-4S binding protein [Rikenellaceae bacterium]